MRHIWIFTMVLFLVFLVDKSFAQSQMCSKIFDFIPHKNNLETLTRKNPPSLESTNLFQTYLANLFEQNILNSDDLIYFIVGLEKNKIINPIAHEMTSQGPLFFKAIHQIHYEAIEKIISTDGLDIQRIKSWVTDLISKLKVEKASRRNTHVDTQEVHQRMEFYRILPGSYVKNSFGKEEKRVRVRRPFELMSTLVTQKHWALIMGENPSKFSMGHEGLEIIVNGKKIKIQPNRPVESVNWEDVQAFLLKLNQLSVEGAPILKQLIPDFKKGDVFRLPTDVEWEYVARAQGTFEGKLPFDEENGDVLEFAWLCENSGRTTQPVALKKPIMVNGNGFYDVLGNVFEWTKSNGQKNSITFLIGENQTPSKLARGGAFSSLKDYVTLGSGMDVTNTNSRYDFMGFRLVREVNDFSEGEK